MFCRIIRGEIAAREVYRSDGVLAIHDISPVAPTHLLVMPTEHVPSLDSLQDPELAGKLLLAVGEVARREGIASSGYRVVVNTGADGGQTVSHLHIHVLGGRRLTWPPG